MIVYPPIAIVYIGSYCAINMIQDTNIWVFMLLILDVFIKRGNCLDIGMGAPTYAQSCLETYYCKLKMQNTSFLVEGE
jgi:hypothetical protein